MLCRFCFRIPLPWSQNLPWLSTPPRQVPVIEMISIDRAHGSKEVSYLLFRARQQSAVKQARLVPLRNPRVLPGSFRAWNLPKPPVVFRNPPRFQMKHAITSSYTPPDDSNGVVALANLDQWIEPGLKLEEGKLGLGFPFMYLLLTGSVGIKVPSLSVPCSYLGCPFFSSLCSIWFLPTVLQDLWVPSTHPLNCSFWYERCFGLGGTDPH